MRMNPTPKDLARLAVQKARAHLEAAKLLSAAGQDDFALFHLLTATEEALKSRLVGEAFSQMTCSLLVCTPEGGVRGGALDLGS